MTTLTLAGVSKAFGAHTILSGIDLAVPSGSLLAILGPSGSGKTTLLRLICGFEQSGSGTIRIGDTLVSGPGLHVLPERRHVGYVAQDGALFPHLSVADNITFGLGRNARRQRQNVAELLTLVGLPAAYADRPPQELSGGEQQRVSLARALAPKPGLVLLDEPFSSLDAGLRAETRQAVAHALASTGATAILVTHDQAEALSMGNEVAVLLNGRLGQVAPPAILYNRPNSAAIARFLGETNLIPGQISDQSVNCALGSLPLGTALPDGPAEVLIRPEQIHIHPDNAGKLMRGTITALKYYGHDVSVSLDVLNLKLIARAAGSFLASVGDEVGLTVEGPVVAFQ